MNKIKLIYEGKAKKVYETDDPSLAIFEYKDSLTAFNAQKKDTMQGKGRLTNLISATFLKLLQDKGIPTHFVKLLDDNHQLVKRLKIIPLEVVVRNTSTGSLCKRLGVEEGLDLVPPLVEFYLKNDELGDPLVTEDHIRAFGFASKPHVEKMKELCLKVNEILSKYLFERGIKLVDFKLEFGMDDEGNIFVADEISPDTCRFWDLTSKERLDKDRFRKDLGNVLEAYEEIWRRIADWDKSCSAEYRANILVYLKEGVLDTQGKAVLSSLHSLGYDEVKNVRVGKYIKITLTSPSQEDAASRVKEMCEDLLVNDLIEEYSFELEEI
ncbi:phosphoribosylaminoimidazolesuccinocarboxamide synthase [Acetomicrobium hydrogeniformans]|jgi:phosphoribosylaminoimidazole-succinocarboxamide synthase|uniref:Multifunctional fusion protein n=1 Tax=Acetomicrobium hydrogeniformans ATCC BAA-1850 TaxID=592015 RepID=A0A0T5X854_9BACT|nr:phosphoribosylaminoimidazolesuccinocarboxamide synthase [Acetomicrobium hydrogeniformans]KRT34502.1 phosphoribosylaminoimidazolesuccinocarboxamide synthase [Acetomicrobium hydrogeniformans ATCC BAA-1850]